MTHRCFLRHLLATLVATTGLGLIAPAGAAPAPGTKFRAYVGTYNGKKSQGIYTFTFNALTGEGVEGEGVDALALLAIVGAHVGAELGARRGRGSGGSDQT